MRVTAVIDSLEQGGAERSLVDLLPHLGALGVDIAVVTVGEPGFLAPAAAAAGATVTGLGASSRHDAVRRLRHHLRAAPPDLVHTTLYEANVCGRLAAAAEGVPVVSSLVNTPYGSDHLGGEGVAAAKVRAAQALDVATARLVRRFHANSDEVARVMRRRLLLGDVALDVIPRGRDPEVLGERTPARRAAARAALGADDTTVVVLAVTRQEPAKGLDVLVDAVARIGGRIRERSIVAVAGREGRASAALGRQVRSNGLDGVVRFLGVRDDVADLLCAADVFVLPSRREGFPGVVVEAMAMGVPVVVSAVGGSLEALGAGTGVVVAVDDPDGLADAITSIVDHPEAAAQRAARARRRFEEHFTTPAVAARTVGFYEAALSSPGRSAVG